MADKLPYFRWFPKDAETSEAYASMTDEQLGFYHRCLNRSWLNDGLPSDAGERARSIQKPQRYADKLWETVGRRFYLDNGRYRNARQEEERTHARKKSKQATDARNSRNGRSTDVDTDVGTDEGIRAYGSGSSSGSSEETTSLEKPSTRARGIPDEEFQDFLKGFMDLGVAVSETDARKCAMLWVGLEIGSRLAAFADVRVKAAPGGDWTICAARYVPRPWNYLTDRQWERIAITNGRAKSATRQETAHAAAARRFMESE